MEMGLEGPWACAMGTRLYVGNLQYNTTEDTLREAFGTDGRTVTNVFIVMDRETGRPRGFAFVEMSTEEEAKAAMAALNNQMVDGRPLRINEAQERTGGAPRRSFGAGPGDRPAPRVERFGGPGGDRGPPSGGSAPPAGGRFNDRGPPGAGGGGGGYNDRGPPRFNDRGSAPPPGGGGRFNDRGGAGGGGGYRNSAPPVPEALPAEPDRSVKRERDRERDKEKHERDGGGGRGKWK